MNVTLGGMALRDGVLLQSERFWAAAVRQPSGGVTVVSGAKPRLPGRERLAHVPVLRGLVRLGESVSALPAVRRASGGPVLPLEDPRLLAAIGASAVVTVALRTARRGSPLMNELVGAAVSLAPVLLLLRDSRLARYHGAEHKSVAAYEAGGEAAAAGKEHARCGSNLIVPMVVASVAGNLALRAVGKERKPIATLVAGLMSAGSAMELFSWVARHQDHPLARALQWPGIELQRLFTTSEPSEDQLDVADLALRELLRLEAAAPPAGAGG
ncbi:MAG: DUF1385 domain-containing protein [Thermoleophilia bacterium]